MLKFKDDLNADLETIKKWAYQWKMCFNPDVKKPAQEIIFSRKNTNIDHPPLLYNEHSLKRVTEQKHLVLVLDEKLNLAVHITEIFRQVTKGIALIRKLNHLLPRQSLIALYKSFVRPHFDYADVVYDQPNNFSFSQKIE